LLNYEVAKLYVGVMEEFHALLTLVAGEDKYSAQSSDSIFGKLSSALFRDMIGHRKI